MLLRYIKYLYNVYKLNKAISIYKYRGYEGYLSFSAFKEEMTERDMWINVARAAVKAGTKTINSHMTYPHKITEHLKRRTQAYNTKN